MKTFFLTTILVAYYTATLHAQTGMNADGRMEFFALGGDKAVWHKWQSSANGGWGEWASLGGTDLRQITTGNNADGRLELIALGGDKAVWHIWQSTPNGGWGGWSALGGTDIQQIITGNNADGRMEIFALGGDGQVWHKWQLVANGGWSEWASLGGTDLLQITVGKNADGRLEVFALGGDKAVWHKWQSSPNGRWGEWALLGGTDLRQVSVGKDADGRMEVFALGGDGAVWHKWQLTANGGWGEWASLGGKDLQQVVVGNNADGRLEVFALGGDGAVWHTWQANPGGGWGGWFSLSGMNLQQITVGNNADGRLEVFALGGDKALWHKWQSSPNGSWGEWASLNGTDLQLIANITDKDHDRINDRYEQKLLKKFRPYYKFSNDGGVDDQRPADAKWFVQHSELFDHHTEQGTPVFAVEQLRADPSLILKATSIGTSDVRFKRDKSDYYLNIYNDFRGGDPDWNHIMSSAVGLYGHVSPLYEDVNNLHTITGYKIEYWQFYAHDNAGAGPLSIHEGDWEGVQLIVENDGNTIRTIIHNIHNIQVRFEMRLGKQFDMGNGVFEFRGINSPKLDVDANMYNDIVQNSLVRLFCEKGECTHPVVYIEHGGHASWPTEYWSWPFVDNHNGSSYSYLVATPPNLGEIGYPDPGCPGADLVLHFNGHWGAYGDGPEGPTVKANQWGKK
ncbi:MAG: hypothetical protein QM802_02570 [Agriterribacter sp.]